MQECKKIEELLFKKLEGELSEDELLSLEEHLESCEVCRKEEMYWGIMQRGLGKLRASCQRPLS